MSQVQRQDAGKSDRIVSDTTSQLSLPARSSRSPVLPLSSNLIPRDFLGQRTDAQKQRNVSAPISRKLSPSPLQASHVPSPTSANTTTGIMSSPIQAQAQAQSQSHSPVTGIEALEDRDRTLDLNEISTTNSHEGRETPDNAVRDKMQPNGIAQSQTSPRHYGQIVQSPPDSPASTVSSVNTERVGAMHIPRTSSIDSAISSIAASPSHSHKSSADSSVISSAEVGGLIAAAGSAEVLIQHLLKEKKHADAQNAQLWKLVEKQRAMVMGLNKDLERAVKDKERYRKKMKDLQERPPPIPQTAIKDDFAITHKPDQKPDPSTGSSTVVEGTGTTLTPHKGLQSKDARSPVDSKLLPSPLHLPLNLHPSPATSTIKIAQANYLQTHPPPSGPPPPPPIEAHSTAGSVNNNLVRGPPSRPPPAESLPATPTGDKDVELPKAKSPEKHITKKAPPAPLDLNGARAMRSHLDSPDSSSSIDSVYGDGTDASERPVQERGRRKTREDDDRDRVIAAKTAEEARSESKQMASTSSERASAASKPGKLVQPSSPRHIVPQVPADAVASGVGSLNALLNPGTTQPPTAESAMFAAPLSPGLPTSPRPLDRPLGSPLPRAPREGATVNSPPLSPRLGAMPSNAPLSPRAPKGPIPLPPNTPISLPSPPSHSKESSLSPLKTEAPQSPRSPISPPPGIPIIVGEHDEGEFQVQSDLKGPQASREIFRGYVGEEYPDLLLPPNALPSIDVKVSSSRLRPSRHSYMALKPQEEDPVFTLSVFARSNGVELWRVEKVILSLPLLDQQLKTVSSFSARLPDRKLFSGHSPALVDARRSALNSYFEEMLDTPMDEEAALVVCRFLSEDAIEPRDDETSLLAPSKNQRRPVAKGLGGHLKKEGYLTKRGKNFGGWKARYFILQGPELKYYESPGGPHLGTIKLPNAQIGKQSQNASPSRSEDDSENQYRHAFLVLEPKRKDSSSLVRHVLCAESDRERDEWVDVLLQYVDYHSQEETVNKRGELSKQHVPGLEAKIKQYGSARDPKNTPTTHNARQETRQELLRGISYEDTVAGAPPKRGETPVDRIGEETPSPTGTHNMFEQNMYEPLASASLVSRGISAPVNGAPIQDAGMWGNKPVPQQAAKDKEHKKRSIWGFRQRSSSDLLLQAHEKNDSDSSLPHSQERAYPVRPVFGIPLAEAVEYCSLPGIDVALPAVIYRCIEYLRAKDAASEEGIFRLSGSNVVVRNLKERFNTEGDVNFLADDQYYDVHAVASLFKTYLRELPTTVLTRELHLDFLHVLELDTKEAKIATFKELVHRLPLVNFELLKVLSEYLIEIVENSNKNKMTVRNVGIVFSPTLNIPAPVFSTFLSDFEAIFGTKPTSSFAHLRETGRSSDTGSATKKPRSTSRDHANKPTSPRHDRFDNTTPANHHAVPQFNGPSHYEVQPAYEQRHYVSSLEADQQQPRALVAGPEYGSTNQHRIVTPNNGSSVKAKRRESSMLLMGMGTANRKSSMPQLREDQTLVAGDASFE